MRQYNFRFFNIISGLEQSGKSFYAIKLAKLYSQKGGIVFTYNPGRLEDYSDYTEIEIVSTKETGAAILDKNARRAYFRNPSIEFFKMQGRTYRMRNWVQVLRGKKAFSFRMPNRADETLFFAALNNYAYNTLVLLDDCRPIFRYSLMDGHIQFFNSKNHAGKKSAIPPVNGQRGLDIIAIFHNLDKVNRELYDYATHITLFMQNQLPKPEMVDNDEYYTEIERAFHELKNLPIYSAIEIGLRRPFYLKKTIIHPSKVQAI